MFIKEIQQCTYLQLQECYNPSYYINPSMFTLYMFISEGKRHDSGMLRMSGLLRNLQQHSFDTSGQPLCTYGDLSYPLRIPLQGPYKGGKLTVDQEEFNSSMSKVREAVEWVFSDIVTFFALLDFKKNLKIGLSPIVGLD